MNSKDINNLIDTINASSLKYFEMTKDDFSIKMSKRDVEVEYKTAVEPSVQSAAPNHPFTQEVHENEVFDKQLNLSADEENEDDTEYHLIKSPIVGTGYLSSSPDTPPFAKVGDKVTKGQTLFIIEAMKVMNEIKSDVDGVVKDILIEDGQAVEFDHPLIKIDTE